MLNEPDKFSKYTGPVLNVNYAAYKSENAPAHRCYLTLYKQFLVPEEHLQEKKKAEKNKNNGIQRNYIISQEYLNGSLPVQLTCHNSRLRQLDSLFVPQVSQNACVVAPHRVGLPHKLTKVLHWWVLTKYIQIVNITTT